MESYTINLKFRGNSISAVVHKFDTFSYVYFHDNEVLEDYGGQHEFNAYNQPLIPEKITAKDSKDFYRAVQDQLH